MLARLWPLLLRVAIGMYFVYPNLMKLLDGTQTLKANIFTCVNAYIPATIAFTAYYGFLVLVGVLCIGLIRSIFPLVVALLILSLELYINFSTLRYTPLTMLLFILILVTLSLIIYTSNNRFNR